MKSFGHFDAISFDDASEALKQSRAGVIAGGTDILGAMRDRVLRDYPEVLVNLKTIADLEYIKEDSDMVRIGALTRLADIAENPVIATRYSALAQAAARTASPHIREMGTIGGNICQLNRCWYFRKANNRFDCIRKGGNMCFAMAGDNRYHSIFGAVKACVAVNPSDTAPALVALDAKVKTNKRTIPIEEFFAVAVPGSTSLESDEFVAEIQLPKFTGKSAFIKFALRHSIDFPVVNCASAVSNGTTRICLNAVYNLPFRAKAAEESINGKEINDASADTAGLAAVSKAAPLANNKYKIQIAKTLVKRTLLACK